MIRSTRPRELLKRQGWAMVERNDRNEGNRSVIEEFRDNGGRVGGRLGYMLLLTTTGAKSGRAYTTPLGYLADGDRLVVIASKGGAPTSPDWYHNLVANDTV